MCYLVNFSLPTPLVTEAGVWKYIGSRQTVGAPPPPQLSARPAVHFSISRNKTGWALFQAKSLGSPSWMELQITDQRLSIIKESKVMVFMSCHKAHLVKRAFSSSGPNWQPLETAQLEKGESERKFSKKRIQQVFLQFKLVRNYLPIASVPAEAQSSFGRWLYSPIAIMQSFVHPRETECGGFRFSQSVSCLRQNV